MPSARAGLARAHLTPNFIDCNGLRGWVWSFVGAGTAFLERAFEDHGVAARRIATLLGPARAR